MVSESHTVYTGFSVFWEKTGSFVQGNLQGWSFGSPVTLLIRYESNGRQISDFNLCSTFSWKAGDWLFHIKYPFQQQWGFGPRDFDARLSV